MKKTYSFLTLTLITLFNILGSIYTSKAQVQWQANGIAICTANNDQESPSIISDGSFGSIVAWEDNRSGSGDIYVQRLAANGTVQWGTNGLGICSASNNQSRTQLVSDNAGGAIIAWSDNRSGSICTYAQRVTSNGSVLWAPNGIVIFADSSSSHQLVSDGVGGAIIACRIGFGDIYAQRVSANGIVQWGTNGLPICVANDLQSEPQLVSDGAGGAIIVWEDKRSGAFDIYAQHVLANGNVQWGTNGLPICIANVGQYFPHLVSDYEGGAIIAWTDKRNGIYNDDIYAQRIDFNGNILWQSNGVAICTASGRQDQPFLVTDGSGGAIIAWFDSRIGNNHIYFQHVDKNGNMLWGTNGLAICTTDDDKYSSRLISDGVGGVIITWEHRNMASYFDIYAQHLSADGNVQWKNNGVAICSASNEQSVPVLTSDCFGGAIIAWKDFRSGNFDIYVQRVNEFSVISPNGNENWAGNNAQEIRWSIISNTSIDHITILYSIDGGITYPNVVVERTSNTGYYIWTVPTINSNTLKVKVQLKNFNNVIMTEDASDTNFTIDSTPPNTFNLISPTNGEWIKAIPTFNWQSSIDNLSGLLKYQLWIDNVVNQDSISSSQTSFIMSVPLSNGLHTWNIKAIDKAGNARLSSQTWSVRIDSEPPASFNLLTPANNIWSVNGRENFSWQPSSDAGSGLNKYVLHIGTQVINLQATQTNYQPSSSLTSGTYQWYVEAIDVVGNIKESSERHTLKVDNTPPNSFNLVSPANSTWTSESTPTFSWAATQDAGSGLAKYELYINNTKIMDNISPLSTSIKLDSTSALNEGSHSWFINAVDAIGNIRKSNQTFTIQIDLTPPSAFSLKSPANNAYVNFPTPDFSWNTTSDNRSGLSHYSLWIDDVLSVDNIISTTSSPGLPLTEGSHIWYVRAVDKVGNWRESSQRWTVIGEWNPPESFDLSFPPNNATVTSGKPVFSWHCTVDIGTGLKKYQLWIDGVLNADNIPASDSMAVPSNLLSNGIHYWFVKAINNADNERASSSTWQVNVDRTGNQAPKIDPISDQTATEDLPFYFKVSASDPNPTDIIRFTDNTDLFDINFYTGEISFTPTNEDVGDHQIIITATDGELNGNSSFKLTVNNINDAPNTFSLLYPAHFALIETLNPTLVWEEAIDIDKNDIVHYRVYIDTLSTFANPIVFDNVANTPFKVPTSLKKSEEYFWKVSAIDLAGAVTECQSFFKFITSATATPVRDHANTASPDEFALFQNYPNPFNPETSISFQIPKSYHVVVKIYNTVGQEISTLIDERREAGYHQIIWDGKDNSGKKVGTGIYIYQMKAENFIAVKKMVMIQ